MSDYKPPIDDILFCLRDVADIASLPAFQAGGLDDDMMNAVLNEAGRLAAEVIAPLNHSGDREGCRLEEGKVTTPKGFREAYQQYRDNGWNSVPFTADYGGQDLPWSLAFGVQEFWQGANMSFGLCPLLNQAAVEAIEAHGTQEQKDTYLAKLISGEWTGTMHLTEPQAGTDLGAVKTRAEKQQDGSYKITGQKIYITYGEHDFADNIIHTVLARTPDAPEGSKGISMFVVPKFIPDENGRPGERNDVYCTGIEHKLGIHASPTCTMQYGDNGGAKGWLIGNELEGLKNMFTMMNNARLSVGLQGVALSERAYQHAVAYAKDRVQSRPADNSREDSVAIIEHADVRRMLMTMRALTESGRALTLEAAVCLDKARGGDQTARSKVDLLTPVVKAWCTDNAIEVASLGIQVHGGMGFIEETGAAQYYRDARILPIYEGTNGIQALDLHGRKILRDKGESARHYIQNLRNTVDTLSVSSAMKESLKQAIEDLQKGTDHLLSLNLAAGTAINVPYLHLFGTIAGGVMLARSANAALKSGKAGERSAFHKNKQATAAFYMTHILPRYKGFYGTVMEGSDVVLDAGSDPF